MLSNHDLKILVPMGGVAFASRAAGCVADAAESVWDAAKKTYEDVEHCEAIGEMCRSKVNENFRFLALAIGCDVARHRPESTRYDNVILRFDGAQVIVGRGYGNGHLIKCNEFRDEFACSSQMTLDLFGDHDSDPSVPEVECTPLVLSWGIETYLGRPSVTFVELQEISGSPQNVIHCIDLLNMRDDSLTIGAQYLYDDDIQVVPKIKRERSSNA